MIDQHPPYDVPPEDVELNRKLLARLPFFMSEYREMTFGSLSPDAEYAGNAYALTLGRWLRGALPSVPMTDERLAAAFALCEEIACEGSASQVNGIIYIAVIENVLSAPVSSVRRYARHMGPAVVDAVLSMAMPERYRSAIEEETGRSGTSAKVWLRDT